MRRLIGILAMLVIAMVAMRVTAAGQERRQDPEVVIAEARKLIAGGELKAAIDRLQALEAAEDPRVAHLLGLAYYSTKDYVRAIERLAPVLDKLPPGSPARREAVRILGLSHYILGHLNEAIPLIEDTLSREPENVELSYALGMSAIQTRQPDRARLAFARMFRVPADSAAAHLLTAQMMVRVEIEELAVVELRRALELDPKLPHANYLLGQTAIYKGRFDEGLEYMRRELEINPGNANAWYKIGDAHTRRLEWDQAIPALQKSVWLNPWFSGPYILLGKAYLKKGEIGNAEGMLRRAIQYDPNNKSAHYLLGQTLQRAGRAEEAKREFEIAERLQEGRDQP